jgi:hypothetical protein
LIKKTANNLFRLRFVLNFLDIRETDIKNLRDCNILEAYSIKKRNIELYSDFYEKNDNGVAFVRDFVIGDPDLVFVLRTCEFLALLRYFRGLRTGEETKNAER